ncbi:Plakophilin-4 [Sparganum proliferum]
MYPPGMRRSAEDNTPAVDVRQLASATAAIQHFSYKNTKIKDGLRKAGALPPLVRLLYSDQPQVLLGATGALRNLTYGGDQKTCMDFEELGGICALAWLVDTQQTLENAPNLPPAATEMINMVLENASATLCNLSLLEALRQPLLTDAVLPTLVEAVLEPVASTSFNSFRSHSGRTQGSFYYNSVFFRNICALLRNISSSVDANNRRLLRACPGLLSALLTVLKVAVASGQVNSMTVENCVTTVRNLCFALPEISDPGYCFRKRARLTTIAMETPCHQKRQILRCRGVGSREIQAPVASSVSLSSNISNLPEALLWHRNTVACLISILRQTSNPFAIEAAIGALQNLSAGEWEPSAQVRREVRVLCGLPLLVELLHAPVCAIVSSAASALRNLAFEPETRDLLGRHALPVIVDSLPSAVEGPSTATPLPESCRVAEYAIRLSPRRVVPLLLLCLTILRGQLVFAQRFVELGGVNRCQYIASVDYTNITCLESDEICNDPCHMARHVLCLLWRMKKLRPIFKIHGWTKADFHPKVPEWTNQPTSTARTMKRGHDTKGRVSSQDADISQYAYPFQTVSEDNRRGRSTAASTKAHQPGAVPLRVRNVKPDRSLNPQQASTPILRQIEEKLLTPRAACNMQCESIKKVRER